MKVHLTAPSGRSMPWSRIEKVFLCCASIFFVLLCIGSIRTESVTNNEMLFVPAGLSYLQRHDGRMDIEEPPLVKLIAAVPAFLLHAKLDYNDTAWNTDPGAYEPEYLFGQKFFETWNPKHRKILFAARLPMIGLALLLGLTLHSMGRELGGPWGAAVALTLFVSSPFFISYGSLVHMDVPIALFSVCTMWSFASLWQKSTKRNALLFAASLAGALVTKFSGLFLLPAILLAWAWFRYVEWRATRYGGAAPLEKPFRREGIALLAMFAAGMAVYLFYFAVFYRSNPRLILENEFNSMAKDGLPLLPIDILVRRMTYHPALESVLLAPSLYAGGLAYVFGHERRTVYFLGHLRQQGVWFYFPVVSFFKLAPGMVLLLTTMTALATISFLRLRSATVSMVPNSKRFHLRSITTGLIVFAAITMHSKLNVGVRHFSVPITFGVLLSSLVIPLIRSLFSTRARFFAFTTTAVLAISCLVTALLTYPHYLSYFNFFRLGLPKQEIAQNSNLNWGQSMDEVALFFREHDVSAPYIDNASTIDPRVYIPGAHVWDCERPNPVVPEWVALSTSTLTHESPRCLDLERYPSWNVGDGAVMIFHTVESPSLSDVNEP